MKKLLIGIFMLFLFAGITFADEMDDLLNDSLGTTIVLPDINLTIQDESEIPLNEQKQIVIEDDMMDIGNVNLEELSTTAQNSEIYGDFDEDVKSGNFSLSTFKLYYGLYDNLLMDINLGKSINQLNYLISYRRNKRSDIGFLTNSYYNTGQELDDLNMDFLIAAGEKVNISASLGYYAKTEGLFTNTVNSTENMIHVPFEIELAYNKDIKSTYNWKLGYNLLNLEHKTGGSNAQSLLNEVAADFNYQIDWSRNNFLKANANYVFRDYSANQFHEGEISAEDQLPIVKSLSLLVGGSVFIYSEKPVFFYPKAFLIYKHESNMFNFKIGIDGDKDSYEVEDYLDESQISYADCYAEEKWSYQAALLFSPVSFATLKINAAYDNYKNLLNFAYNAGRELYYPVALTNVNVVDVKAIFEMLIAESLTFTAGYEYRYTKNEDLLFFPANQASVILDYKNIDWGFQFTTGVTYQDIQLILPGVEIESRVIWDVNLSKSISDEIFIEVKVNNILNQDNFDRVFVPNGGLNYHAGIKLLL